jgi:serine O-acetyltransferase
MDMNPVAGRGLGAQIRTAWKAFWLDVNRYRMKPRPRWAVILFSQGLWACAVYRLFYPFVRAESRVLRRCAHLASMVALKWIEIVAGISLPPESEVGAGLFIGHFGGIVINPRTTLGRNCNVNHGVTIGSGGRKMQEGESVEGVPSFGDRVYIGPGACVFGRISIGNDVAIGANAVVTRDLPERAVAVGVPAKIISRRGSFLYVNYLGMETDPERQQSLAMAADTAE